MVSAAFLLTDSISSSYVFRTARLSGSTRRAKAIMGSSLASTAAFPPSQSFLRSATSRSFVPPTSRFASSAGDSAPSTFLTKGWSGPSISRMRVSEPVSLKTSNSS